MNENILQSFKSESAPCIKQTSTLNHWNEPKTFYVEPIFVSFLQFYSTCPIHFHCVENNGFFRKSPFVFHSIDIFIRVWNNMWVSKWRHNIWIDKSQTLKFSTLGWTASERVRYYIEIFKNSLPQQMRNFKQTQFHNMKETKSLTLIFSSCHSEEVGERVCVSFGSTPFHLDTCVNLFTGRSLLSQHCFCQRVDVCGKSQYYTSGRMYVNGDQ